MQKSQNRKKCSYGVLNIQGRFLFNVMVVFLSIANSELPDRKMTVEPDAVVSPNYCMLRKKFVTILQFI